MHCFSDHELQVRTLTTSEEKDKAYHLRHKVFAEELGWVPRSETGRELDDYDVNCVMIGIFADNRIIACLRILLADQRFMLEKEFNAIMSDYKIIKTPETIEVTRFCISSDVRKSKVSTNYGVFPIIMALEKAFYNWCRSHGIDIVYMVVSKHFFRLLNLLGMPCTAVAPAVTMPDSVVALAAVSSWTAFEKYNTKKNPALLSWFRDVDQFNFGQEAA